MTNEEAKSLKPGDVVRFYHRSAAGVVIGEGSVVETRVRRLFKTPVVLVASKLTKTQFYFGRRTEDVVVENYISTLKPKDIITGRTEK